MKIKEKTQPIEDLKILTGKERKELLSRLKEQFEIQEIDGMLLRRGKERIFLYQGNLDEEEIRKLERVTFIERVGVYLGKEQLGEIRLSIEGAQILKKQINKNVVELNYEEMQTWMMGHELRKETGLGGFVAMKYETDMLGCGKASVEKISNFIPKSRRLRDKTIEA